MNRVMISLVSLIFCAVQLTAQDFLPMPTENAKWIISKYSYGGAGGTAETGYKIYTDGDTVLAGETYTKLHSVRLWNFGTNPDGTTFDDETDIDNGIVAAFRNEGMRTYFHGFSEIIYEYSTCEWMGSPLNLPIDTTILLYDFDMQVGDTLFLPVTNEPLTHVQSIDSILLVDGLYHTQIHFAETGGTPLVWTEQAGANYGIFSAYHSGRFFYGSNYSLSCFAVNGKYLFGEDSCDFRDATPIWEPITMDTPVWYQYGDELTIQHAPDNIPADILIYDLNGKLLLQQHIASSAKILLQKLPAGMYIALMQTGSGQWSKKICIQ